MNVDFKILFRCFWNAISLFENEDLSIKFDFLMRFTRQESNNPIADRCPVASLEQVSHLATEFADAAGFFRIFSLRWDLWQRFDFIAYCSARPPPRRPAIFAVSHFVFLPCALPPFVPRSPLHLIQPGVSNSFFSFFKRVDSTISEMTFQSWLRRLLRILFKFVIKI